MVVLRKMKEKCKDAARLRREKERVEFVELSKLLPLPSSTTGQLDKASIIRLTSSYLRMRAAFPQGLGENWGTKQRPGPRGGLTTTAAHLTRDDCALRPGHDALGPSAAPGQQIKELGSLLLQTLDGFVFALHRDGKIMYISETASVHLGLPQIDLTGSSVFEYIHPADHNGLMEVLNLTEAEHADLLDRRAVGSQNQQHDGGDILELGRSFCMRMKCVLPKRNAGLVSNGYKAIHCSGYLKVRYRRPGLTAPAGALKRSKFVPALCDSRAAGETQHTWESYALVAVGHSLLPTASTETKLGSRTFMFRANLDLRLYYLESQMSTLLGYQQSELVGQSLYQFVHIADLSNLERAHKQVLDKGQVVSRYHRLMRRDGGYVWIQTHATLINNPRSMPKPQHIVGICCVIGENQFDDSRSLLIGEPSVDKLELMSNPTGGKKSADKAPTPLKKLSSTAPQPVEGSLKLAHSSKLTSQRQIVKRDRSHRPATQVGGKFAARPTSCKQRAALKLGGKFATNSSNNPTGAYHTIGSTRRPSDDTCSVVSSIASTTSTSSACGYNCASFSRTPSTSTALASSAQQDELPAAVADYAFKNNCIYAYDCQLPPEQLPAAQLAPSVAAFDSDQYSSRAQAGVISYDTQDYWSLPVVSYEQTTGQPMSVDGACNQEAMCWPADAPTSNSPSLTTSSSQMVGGQLASIVSPPDCGYTMSPGHAYACDQYYYKLDGQTIVQSQDYNQDEYNAAYSSEVQTYSDYQEGVMARTSMLCEDQTYSYYTTHQGPACLGGSSST